MLLLGGVVYANLRVYGLANVRVADASVPPMAFSAHLMSSTYGLAEQASTMIRAYHNKKISTTSHHHHNSTNSTSSHDGSNSTDSAPKSSASTTGNHKDKNGSGAAAPLHLWPLFLGVAVCVASEWMSLI